MKDTVPTNLPLPGGEGWGEGADGDARRSPKAFRRGLREASTPAEKQLWSLLRGRRLANLKFRRQHTVGPYVVDFLYREARVVIELDGSVHDDPARAAYDGRRQSELEKGRLRVLRVSNADLLQSLEAVLARIVEVVTAPHPGPLPEGEGGS